MTQFRFVVTTIPLKAILLSSLLGSRRFYPSTRKIAVIPYFLAICILPWQSGENPNIPIPSEPDPIALRDIDLTSLSGLQAQIINSSQINRRDSNSIKLFIETKLGSIVDRSHDRICFATYQAGYFPWILRDHFSADQIYIVDTLGLNNRLIAKREAAKSPIGVVDGLRIDDLIIKKNKELFSLCGGKKPDLIYLLKESDAVIDRYISEGYKVIWKDPGAIVFSL